MTNVRCKVPDNVAMACKVAAALEGMTVAQYHEMAITAFVNVEAEDKPSIKAALETNKEKR